MKTSKKKYNSRKNKKSNKNVKNYSRKNKINKINKLKGGNLDENILQRISTNDPTFTILNINKNYFGTEGAKALATALTVNTSLITLEISMNNINPDGAKALATALENNKTLTKIDISINYIGDAGAQALAGALAGMTALTTLDISNNYIGPAGAKALAGALAGMISLTELNISDNNIDPDGAKALATALQNNAKLTTLDIRANNIGPDGAIALAGALQGNTTLTELDIRNNKLGPAGAEALSGALAGMTALTELNISSNKLGDAGAQALAGALTVNTTLTTLYNLNNNIGPEGAKALAGSLASNATLTILDIRNNKLGDAGAQALAGALQGNTKLTTLLYINRNLIINNESVEALLNALKVNKTLKIIDIEEIIDSSHNDIKQKIMKILKNRNNSILFNPILKPIDTTTDTDEITKTIDFIKDNIRVKPKLLSDEQLKTLTESDIETINSVYKTNTIDEYIQYLISFSQPDDKKLPETDNTNQFYSLIDNNNKSGALAISNIETSEKYVINLHGEVRSTIFKLPENINIVFLSPIRYLICKKNDISILQNIATNINTFLTNPYCAEIQQNFRQSLVYLGGQYCPDLSLLRSIKDHVTGIHYINSNTLQNAYAYDSGKLDTTLSQFLNDENDSQRTKFSSNKETQYTIILTSCRETDHLSNLTADVLVFYEQLVKLINYRIYYNNFLKTKLTFNNNVNQAYKYCRTLKYTNIDMESKRNNINQLQMYRNKNNNNNNNNSKGKFYSRNSNNTNNTTLITKLKQKITDYKLNPITIDKQDLFELLITNLKFEKNIFHNQEKYKNSIYSKDKDKFDIIKKIFGNDYDLMFEFVLNVDAQFHIINFKYIFKDKNKIDINKITYRITLSALKFILIFFDKTLNEFKNLNLGIKKEEIKDLVDILQNNTTITTLYIISNNIDSEGAKALSGALAGMTSLTELNISGNKIGPEGAIALAGALAGMTALTTLDISNNFFGNDGAQALAGAIAGNKILTTLNISNNYISDDGAKAFAEALKSNATLTTLNMSYNDIHDAGAIALAGALKTNTTLTKLIFSSFFINDTVKTQLETNTRIQFV